MTLYLSIDSQPIALEAFELEGDSISSEGLPERLTITLELAVTGLKLVDPLGLNLHDFNADQPCLTAVARGRAKVVPGD